MSESQPTSGASDEERSSVPRDLPAKPRADRAVRRRRLKIAFLAVAAVVVGVAATPFLFTGTLVRYLVAHSTYRNLPLTFESARLSPVGVLTVRGVVIGDQKESQGKRLVSADEVRVAFDWGEIRSGRVKTIVAENVDATLRPGDDTALTLTRLFSSDADTAAESASTAAATLPAAATTGKPAKKPFWFDQIVLAGKVRFEGYGAWQDVTRVNANDALPARLVITSSGAAAAPAREYALTVGDADAAGAGKPALVTHLRQNTVGAETVLVLESLTLSNLLGKGSISADARYIATTKTLEAASVRLRGFDGADLAGRLPAGMTATGRVEGDFEYAMTGAGGGGGAGGSGGGGELVATVNVPAGWEMKVPDGALTVAGAPEISLRGRYDAAARVVEIQAAGLRGLESVRADAGFVKYVQAHLGGAARDAAEGVFKQVAEGAFAALGEVSVTGKVDLGAAGAGGGPAFAGKVAVKELTFGKSADAPMMRNFSVAAEVATPVSAADWNTLKVSEGKISFDKLTLGKNNVDDFSADVAVDHGLATVANSSFSFSGGRAKGGGAVRLPGQLESLRLDFVNVDQQILTAALYPDAFRAEGPVTMKLDLTRTSENLFAGGIEITSEAPGRLKISRETAANTFAQAAKAAASAAGSMLPPNFDEIAIQQLENYPYERGYLLIQDNAQGAQLKFDYRRPALKEGEPGYGVVVPVGGQQMKTSPAFQLSGYTLNIKNYTVMALLEKLTGVRDSLVVPGATRPATGPAGG